MTGNDYALVMTTIDDESKAQTLADALVEARLAACIQIVGPIRSTYPWKGKVEHATEWLLLIKSRKALYRSLEAFIREHHAYEVPELVQLDITAGLPEYLSWISQNTHLPRDN
ncbi:MAG: divalent-cation tolerance protein CutA [Planctomycetota bacterium]|nr:MAG: divalent-cation tolerance protein CutA [Planctomycetota bacterium]